MNSNEYDRFDLMTLILLRENLIHRGQAHGLMAEKQALRKQGRVVPTCELALAFKYITREQAELAVALYTRLAQRPGQSRPLGWLLLEAGLVSPTQLLAALERQQAEGGRLGRVLVEMGHLTPVQLEMFLTLQLAESRTRAA